MQYDHPLKVLKNSHSCVYKRVEVDVELHHFLCGQMGLYDSHVFLVRPEFRSGPETVRRELETFCTAIRRATNLPIDNCGWELLVGGRTSVSDMEGIFPIFRQKVLCPFHKPIFGKISSDL